jgi:HEAT repeat protein
MKNKVFLTCILFISSTAIFAQKIIIGSRTSITNADIPGRSNIVWNSGFSQTKNDLMIPFELCFDDDQRGCGYKYKCQQMESIADNDVIRLFIPDLDYRARGMTGMTQTYYDDCDKDIIGIPELNGAWKDLTILKKIQKSKNELVLVTKEFCDPYETDFIDSISFTATDDYYFYKSSSFRNRTRINNTVASLLPDLNSKSADVRKRTVTILRRKHDVRAVDPLISALKYKDSYPEVLEALYAIKPDWTGSVVARNAVPGYISMLGSENSTTRIQAAEILACIKDNRALTPMISALKYKDSFEAVQKALKTAFPDWMHTDNARNTVPLFIAALKDKDETIRMQAAAVLFLINDPRAFQPFIAALNDESWVVRTEAIVALKSMKDERAVNPLMQALEDENATVRIKAADALAEMKVARAAEPMIHALRYPDSYLNVKKALDILNPEWMRTEEARNAVPELVGLLKTEDIYVLYQAARMFETINDKRAVEAFIYALKYKPGFPSVNGSLNRIDPDWARTEAARNAVPTYIVLLDDLDSSYREQAAMILGEIIDTRSVEPLIMKLKDNVMEVRRKAASSLGRIKDPRAVEPLILSLNDENEEVRRDAVEALGFIKDRRAVEPLIAALKDDDSDVRGKATWSLIQLKDTRSVGPLVNLLNDRNNYFYAVRALDSIKPDWRFSEAALNAVPSFIAQLNDEDNNTRSIAIYALEHIRDPRSVKPLIATLADKSGTIRSNAAFALGRIGDTRAVKPLIPLLNDEYVSVRRSAATALGRLKDQKAVNPLLGALKDRDIGVRKNAAEALEEITGNAYKYPIY